MPDLVEIAGSAPALLPGFTPGAALAPDEVVEARLELRPGSPLPPPAELCRGRTPRLDLDSFTRRHGMRAEDLAQVERVLRPHGIALLAEGRTCWSVRVRGPARAFAAAFGVELRRHRGPDGGSHVARTGPVFLPAELAGIVRAVTGLDRRPTPRAGLDQGRLVQHAPVEARTPQDWAARYSFPSAECSGQTVALLEFPARYSQALLATAYGNLGVAVPQIDAYPVEGGTIQSDADDLGETGLDLVIAGTLAPGARLALVAGMNQFEDMGIALFTAVVAGARVVSISYGAPETVPQGSLGPGGGMPGHPAGQAAWPAMNIDVVEAYCALAAMLGATVCVAAGDNGSTAACSDPAVKDSPYVLAFPASCPLVLACGGTQIPTTGSGEGVEEVWNFPALGILPEPPQRHQMIGGGGVSLVYPLPAFQDGIGVPAYPGSSVTGRGCPDLAVAAAYYDFGPGVGQYYGTSAASPCIAGLVAQLNAALPEPLGLAAPRFYAAYATQQAGETAVFTDITAGGNAPPAHDFFPAGPGWDAASGMGTPIGTALLAALQAQAAAAG